MQFTYLFEFETRAAKTFIQNLDDATFTLLSVPSAPTPEWTKLDFNTCDNCPLSGTTEYCPVAVNLTPLLTEFRDCTSHEKVRVTVTSPDRSYIKETTIQRGLSSILGLYMSTSGCPVLDQLRPMARTHLPFSNIMETIYRAVSNYLTRQYFVFVNGGEPDWEMHKLSAIYKDVGVVNRGLSRRFASASEKDANINAIIILHSFGDTVPFFIDNKLEEIRHWFSQDLPEYGTTT